MRKVFRPVVLELYSPVVKPGKPARHGDVEWGLHKGRWGTCRSRRAQH